jgi:hypothetical protein
MVVESLCAALDNLPQTHTQAVVVVLLDFDSCLFAVIYEYLDAKVHWRGGPVVGKYLGRRPNLDSFSNSPWCL